MKTATEGRMTRIAGGVKIGPVVKVNATQRYASEGRIRQLN
jgi:hypothetical protein